MMALMNSFPLRKANVVDEALPEDGIVDLHLAVVLGEHAIDMHVSTSA